MLLDIAEERQTDINTLIGELLLAENYNRFLIFVDGELKYTP